ncbi:SOS response-associated peptidase [Mangrovibacterium lignilyticum]|uniref:SOS response-associated peptidase n=1 Tax=Mangrovibacterium lignilyticum TaxID=2668052 RepID=UPI0013D1DC55|nr:SOS response-associated peptidase [Mangrovibacterium lignilyticum]
MCYDVRARLLTQLNRAIAVNNKKKIEEIAGKLKEMGADDLFHRSGFEHPAMLIYTQEHPDNPVVARWGFVPESTKDTEKQLYVWNKTLNARGEDMFETWSYKNAARNKRCLICIDGFFEHYHFKGKTFPYYIYADDGQPLTLGGLWSDWENRESGELMTTFSIVTTEGNDLLARIHNNPKLEGPRMPLILPEQAQDEWLSLEVKTEAERKRILELIRPNRKRDLQAHTVQRIRGKEAVSNNPKADQKLTYPELAKKENEDNSPTLF